MKEDGNHPRGWGEALVSSWMKTTIDVEMGGGTIVERNESIVVMVDKDVCALAMSRRHMSQLSVVSLGTKNIGYKI